MMSQFFASGIAGHPGSPKFPQCQRASLLSYLHGRAVRCFLRPASGNVSCASRTRWRRSARRTVRAKELIIGSINDLIGIGVGAIAGSAEGVGDAVNGSVEFFNDNILGSFLGSIGAISG